MGEKRVKGKAIPKHETEADWLQSAYIPEQGEIVVYDADATHTKARQKIGDGIKTVKDLPFSGVDLEEAQDLIVPRMRLTDPFVDHDRTYYIKGQVNTSITPAKIEGYVPLMVRAKSLSSMSPWSYIDAEGKWIKEPDNVKLDGMLDVPKVVQQEIINKKLISFSVEGRHGSSEDSYVVKAYASEPVPEDIAITIKVQKTDIIEGWGDTTTCDAIIPKGKSESDWYYVYLGWVGSMPEWHCEVTNPVKKEYETSTEYYTTWNTVSGALLYEYITGEVKPYKTSSGNPISFSNTYNRAYVEMSKDRGVYTRYALTGAEAPPDPDPEDFAVNTTMDSIPLRNKDGFVRVPKSSHGADQPNTYGLDEESRVMSKKYIDTGLKNVLDKINDINVEGDPIGEVTGTGINWSKTEQACLPGRGLYYQIRNDKVLSDNRLIAYINECLKNTANGITASGSGNNFSKFESDRVGVISSPTTSSIKLFIPQGVTNFATPRLAFDHSEDTWYNQEYKKRVYEFDMLYTATAKNKNKFEWVWGWYPAQNPSKDLPTDAIRLFIYDTGDTNTSLLGFGVGATPNNNFKAFKLGDFINIRFEITATHFVMFINGIKAFDVEKQGLDVESALLWFNFRSPGYIYDVKAIFRNIVAIPTSSSTIGGGLYDGNIAERDYTGSISVPSPTLPWHSVNLDFLNNYNPHKLTVGPFDDDSETGGYINIGYQELANYARLDDPIVINSNSQKFLISTDWIQELQLTVGSKISIYVSIPQRLVECDITLIEDSGNETQKYVYTNIPDYANGENVACYLLFNDSEALIPVTRINAGTLTGGYENLIGAGHSIMFGRWQENYGHASMLVGEKNKNYARVSSMFGTNHLNNGAFSFLSGEHNKNKGKWNFLAGYDLTSSGNCQAIFGQHNAPEENAVLMVGAGSTGNLKNAFTVYKDGTAKLGDKMVATEDKLDEQLSSLVTPSTITELTEQLKTTCYMMAYEPDVSALECDYHTIHITKPLPKKAIIPAALNGQQITGFEPHYNTSGETSDIISSDTEELHLPPTLTWLWNGTISIDYSNGDTNHFPALKKVYFHSSFSQPVGYGSKWPEGLEVYFDDFKEYCECSFEDAGYVCPISESSKIFINGVSAQNLDIPEGTRYIGGGVFSIGAASKMLKKIVHIPSSVTSIDRYAFSGANNEFIFSEGLTHIGENAFTGNEAIQKIVLPSSIENIEYNAFGDCSQLTEIHVPWPKEKIEGPWGAENATIYYNSKEPLQWK